MGIDNFYVPQITLWHTKGTCDTNQLVTRIEIVTHAQAELYFTKAILKIDNEDHSRFLQLTHTILSTVSFLLSLTI